MVQRKRMYTNHLIVRWFERLGRATKTFTIKCTKACDWSVTQHCLSPHTDNDNGIICLEYQTHLSLTRNRKEAEKTPMGRENEREKRIEKRFNKLLFHMIKSILNDLNRIETLLITDDCCWCLWCRTIMFYVNESFISIVQSAICIQISDEINKTMNIIMICARSWVCVCSRMKLSRINLEFRQ